MEAKIIALGPEKVSHHAADLTKLNVFDVAPSSIPPGQKSDWETAIEANRFIAKFIFPPLDPGYHFEIKQPQKLIRQNIPRACPAAARDKISRCVTMETRHDLGSRA